MEAIYAYFSSSGNGAPAELESMILRARDGSALLARARESESIPHGMRDTLVATVELGRTPLWDESIGRLLADATPSNPPAEISFVEASLYANLTGTPGDWCFSFPKPTDVRCGPVIIRDVCRISAKATSRESLIRVIFAGDDERSIRFAKNVLLTRINNNRVVQIQRRLERHDISLTCDRDRLAEVLPDYADVGISGVNLGQNTKVITAALDLLRCDCEPQYDWVRSVIRRVGFLDAPEGNLSSSSSPALYGTIGITAFQDPVSIAEMLVHEASHQHFFIAKRLGQIHDGTDDTLHFSPMAGKRRPLEPLLLAFHALGNMALMYASLAKRQDGFGAYSARRLQEVLAQANDLGQTIAGNAALTALGSGLFHPLHSQIQVMS